MMTAINQYRLPEPVASSSINSTTKTPEATCTAFNRAFFVPKICQKSPGLVVSDWQMGMKNRTHITSAVGSRGLNTRPFYGNKSRRLVSVVEARPPENLGGQKLTKTPGGHPMPVKSLRQTVGNYQLSISLPTHDFISEFVASFNGISWTITVVTTKGQTVLIKDQDGDVLRFANLEMVALFLAGQGATALSVSLLGLTNGGAA